MSDTKAVAAVAKERKVETAGAPSVIARLADRFGVDQSKMLECLKSTAFRGGCTNEQLMALCIVSEQYGLNPWTREIYAFPDKQNGIVPVVGVDGWARIINTHPQFDGVEFEQDSDKCTCSIYRKDRSHPVQVTEYMAECKRNTGPWGSHPMRMLRHKALIQAARLAFGFTGIYDQDEAERIVSARVGPAAYAKASPLDSVVVPQSDGVPKADDAGSVAEPQEPQEPQEPLCAEAAPEDVPY
jgi:phage recombination protein Bet